MENDVTIYIDNMISSLQHPFFMMTAGIVFWFSIIWSVQMSKRSIKKASFFQDQKDEIWVAFVGGLIFLVWDDEVLQAIEYVKDVWVRGEDPETWAPTTAELQPFMYLLVAPFIDIILNPSIKWLIHKFKKNGKETENPI